MSKEHYHDARCPADRRYPRWSEPNCICKGEQHTNMTPSARDREMALTPEENRAWRAWANREDMKNLDDMPHERYAMQRLFSMLDAARAEGHIEGREEAEGKGTAYQLRPDLTDEQRAHSFISYWMSTPKSGRSMTEVLKHRFAEARAEEREACAKVAEMDGNSTGCPEGGSRRQCHVAIAAAIRARSAEGM